MPPRHAGDPPSSSYARRAALLRRAVARLSAGQARRDPQSDDVLVVAREEGFEAITQYTTTGVFTGMVVAYLLVDEGRPVLPLRRALRHVADVAPACERSIWDEVRLGGRADDVILDELTALCARIERSTPAPPTWREVFTDRLRRW